MYKDYLHEYFFLLGFGRFLTSFFHSEWIIEYPINILLFLDVFKNTDPFCSLGSLEKSNYLYNKGRSFGRICMKN